MNKYCVIGDIHGDLFNLVSLLKNIKIENRILIFLGDYVNKGNSSKETIDFLIKFNL